MESVPDLQMELEYKNKQLTYEIKDFKTPLKLTNKIIDDLLKNYIKKNVSYNLYI